MKEKYGLYQRIVNKRKIWYFWFYPDDNSTKRIQKSTGKQTKWEAKQFVEAYFKKIDEKEKIENDLTFKEFTKNFFIWDECKWIKSQHEKGKPFDISIAKIRRAHLLNYLWPEFGNERFSLIGSKESKIKSFYIEDWLSDLPLANQTKNQILYTFKIIMRWAYRQELILFNPIEAAESASKAEYKKRDILSLDELKELFPADLQKLIEIWGSLYWSALFLLMITTGMRSQEIRALLWGDIVWDENIILIQRAVKLHGAIGSLKSNYDKATFLPDRTIQILLQWKKESIYSHDQSLIFYGEDEYTPLPRDRIGDVLQQRLKSIAVIASRKHITPHCFRTTYNTYMRQNISESLLRLQLGHRSATMTDRYDRGVIIDKLLPYQGEREKINQFWDTQKS